MGNSVEKQWYVDNTDFTFRFGIIRELNAVGVDWLSREGLVYQRIRFWETDGKYGFMVEGEQSMSEYFVGSTPEQIRTCLKNLQKKGLVFHVQCDQRVYRNKTKIWMSAVRLAGASTAVEAIKVLAKNQKNTSELTEHPLELKAMEGSLVGLASPTNGTSKSHELDVQVPPNRGTNIERNKNDYSQPAYVNQDELPPHSVGGNLNDTQGVVVKITTPFGEDTTTPVNVKKSNPNRYIVPLATRLLEMSGAKGVTPGPDLRSAVQARLKQGYTEADLKLIVLTAKEDKFYKDFPVARLLREDIAEELLKKSKRKGGKPKSRLAQIYGA